MNLSKPWLIAGGVLVGIVALGLIGWLIWSRTQADGASAETFTTTQTIIEYGELCAEAIGDIPPFNCLDGDIVPITINGGAEPASYSKGMLCDRPALLPYEDWSDGQCTPYTRALNLSAGTAQISAMCRRKVIREPDSPLFDEVDIIAHSSVDGSTCWFKAADDTGAGMQAIRVPPPNETTPPEGFPSAETFWRAPASVAAENCGHCHDNDPFMYSPYVGQVWNRLPADPFGWYKHIGPGFSEWPQPVSLSTRQNPCLGCHRLGVTFTGGQATKEATGMIAIRDANQWALDYPGSHWMPPGNFHTKLQWDVIYEMAVADILACFEDPTLPFCVTEPITGLPGEK